jgi:hypothetical protein
MITEDGGLGEVVFYALQVLYISLFVYLAIWMAGKLRGK